MKKFKERWEISQNWQLLHVIMGLVATFFSAYLISKKSIGIFVSEGTTTYDVLLFVITIAISISIIKCTLWLFSKLYKRWAVTYRWELIAIFMVFALTGSTAGRLSDPLMELLGLAKEDVSGWVYWPVRILLIFPIYQVLLVFFGWVFGQFTFFKSFAVKMLVRIGFGFLFTNRN